MLLQRIESDLAPAALGGYSQAMLAGDVAEWLFVSGQIPEDREGDVPVTFTDQCRLVWSHVAAQLEAAGMSVANLVKVTTYLSARVHAAENRAVRAEVLGEHRPALTVVICDIFDERWFLEIDAVAAR